MRQFAAQPLGVRILQDIDKHAAHIGKMNVSLEMAKKVSGESISLERFLTADDDSQHVAHLASGCVKLRKDMTNISKSIEIVEGQDNSHPEVAAIRADIEARLATIETHIDKALAKIRSSNAFKFDKIVGAALAEITTLKTQSPVPDDKTIRKAHDDFKEKISSTNVLGQLHLDGELGLVAVPDATRLALVVKNERAKFLEALRWVPH